MLLAVELLPQRLAVDERHDVVEVARGICIRVLFQNSAERESVSLQGFGCVSHVIIGRGDVF